MIKELIPPLIGKALSLSSLFFPQWTSVKGIELFCTPRKGEIRLKDKKYLETCQKTEAFQIELGSIQYYIWNEEGAKTILLLHGWESNSARWRFLIDTLKDTEYRVVSLDAPAHGASNSKTFDMHQYAQAIDVAVRKFKVNTLVGHSAAGLAISYYLSNFEHDSFDSLIYLGAPSGLRQISGNYYDILKPSMRVRRLLEQHFETKFDLKIDDFAAHKFIVGNTTPTLIIHDAHDVSVSVENAKEYDKHFANSTLMITEGYGHGLQHKKIFKTIIEFLKSSLVNT